MRLRLRRGALDGKSALDSCVSQWITGPAARRDGHRWRARACAILTGIGTVREDDPQLSVRDVPCSREAAAHPRPRTPGGLRAGPHPAGSHPILIATASTDEARIDALRAACDQLVCAPNAAGKVELGALLRLLGERGVKPEPHVEAGFSSTAR